MRSRIISGIIAAAYLVAAYLMANGDGAFTVAVFLILPLACIWFSDALGEFTGLGFPSLTGTTPGWVVAFGGWLLLVLPVVIWLIMGLVSNR
jgi:hypothetical protein